MAKSKEVQRFAARRHYEKNAERMKARAVAYTKEERRRKKRYILDYLSANPCVDCGESDPVVLEFDHIDRSEKLFNIGNAGSRGISMKKLIAEIDKCEVRCANCHRRRTVLERHWLSTEDEDDDQMVLI